MKLLHCTTLPHPHPLPTLPLSSPRASRPAPASAILHLPKSRFLQPGGPWWKAPRPNNMAVVDSVQQLVDELEANRERLVVVEVSGRPAGSCLAGKKTARGMPSSHHADPGSAQRIAAAGPRFSGN